jgi:RHS repeat-associated protein
MSDLPSQTNTFDAAAQLKEAAYDKMGRLTLEQTRTYNWNLASQLTSFKDATNSESFTYDGLGLLNTMTNGRATRAFVMNYGVAYPALSIVRQGSSDVRYYIYLPNGNLLYSVEVDGTRHFYHFDEVGNTVMLTNDAGAMTDSYAITPYGDIVTHQGTTDNPFTWQGEFGAFEESSGLYNLRARHYDSSTGRFISRDPLQSAEPANSEPYAFADGNPLLYNDPLGLASSPIQGVVSGIVNGVETVVRDVVNGVVQVASAVVGFVEKVITPHLPPCSSCAKSQAPQKVASEPAPVQYVPEASAVVNNKPLNVSKSSAAKPGDGAIQTQWTVKDGILLDSNGQVVSHDGGTVVSHDGGTVVSHDGGTVVSHDGGTVVSHDGGTVVSHDGGTVRIAEGSLIRLADGSLYAVGAKGSLISQDGNGLIATQPSLVSLMPTVGLIGQDGLGLIGKQ